MAVFPPKSHSSVAAEALNQRGQAEAKLAYWGKPARYILTLQWKKAGSPDGGEFLMSLVRSGPREEIITFVEEYLLKFPDADLMSEALQKANEKLPEDLRLF
jgi:hypothetical protein